MKKATACVLAALMLISLSSCGGGEGSDTAAEGNVQNNTTAADTTAADTTAEETGDIMKLEADFSAEPIVFERSGDVYQCLDLGKTSYEAVFTAECEKNRTAAVMFKYKDEDNTYELSVNPARRTVVLNNISSGETKKIESVTVPYGEEGKMILKMQVNGTVFRLYSLDNPYDTDPYPIIDVRVSSRTAIKGIAFSMGAVELKDITLSSCDIKYEKDNRYMNPISSIDTGADPFILSHEGMYYLYSTNAPADGYRVYVSSDLANWKDEGYCLRAQDVAGKATSSQGFWAPEVYYYDGQFIMIYTVGEHLGIATSSSPLGPFTNKERGLLSDELEIDGHLFFDDDGKVYNYFVRSRQSNASGKGNEIYGCEFDMKTLTRKTEPVRLLWPETNWEVVSGSYIVEGPFMLKHNGLYYLTYTANGYDSPRYAVGFATSKDPLGGFKKFPDNPVLKLSEANEMLGPGHHSFFTNGNGVPFIVYHVHKSATVIHPRPACIDRYKFQKVPGYDYDVIQIDGPSQTMRYLPINITK